MRAIILLLASLLCLASKASDSIAVSFVNFYPGEIIYELDGHSAIRVRDGKGLDMAVNYGLFEFAAPNFMLKFLKGETDYICGAMPWTQCMSYYMAHNRRIVEHPIDMDSLQKQRLVELLNENLKPENRTYRYNYVKDNCALRPLHMIERAMSDTISLPQPTGEAGEAGDTYRDIMRHYHRNYPWYQFGIDLALGSGIDYKLSPWEKAFSPVVLDAQLDGATIGGKKLTKGTVVLNQGVDATLPPTPWYLTPMFAACLLLFFTILLTIRDFKRLSVSRWFDTLLFTIFGLAGLVLTFLIFVSVHEATSPNWLYLWLNPLCLIVPIFIWLKKCNLIVYWYQIVNFALILLMVIAWPFTGQSGNYAFIPLIACDLLRSFNYIYVTTRRKEIRK